MDGLENLSYRQLQKKAKEAGLFFFFILLLFCFLFSFSSPNNTVGLRANQKKNVLLDQLRDYLKEQTAPTKKAKTLLEEALLDDNEIAHLPSKWPVEAVIPKPSLLAEALHDHVESHCVSSAWNASSPVVPAPVIEERVDARSPRGLKLREHGNIDFEAFKTETKL